MRRVLRHNKRYHCYAELPVSVELNGESDEQFHETIDCGEGQPLPDEAADGLMIAGDASGVFHNFHFTEPGDYVYTVRQESADTEHMTYDGTVYTVTIRVTNAEGGGLQHEIWATTDDAPDTKVEELRFLNTYAPPVPTPETTPSAEPTPVPDPGHPTLRTRSRTAPGAQPRRRPPRRGSCRRPATRSRWWGCSPC